MVPVSVPWSVRGSVPWLVPGLVPWSVLMLVEDCQDKAGDERCVEEKLLCKSSSDSCPY